MRAAGLSSADCIEISELRERAEEALALLDPEGATEGGEAEEEVMEVEEAEEAEEAAEEEEAVEVGASGRAPPSGAATASVAPRKKARMGPSPAREAARGRSPQPAPPAPGPPPHFGRAPVSFLVICGVHFGSSDLQSAFYLKI